MNELEQVKKRIKQLSEHVERIEQEIKEKEKQQEPTPLKLEHPNVGQDYYFMSVESGTVGIIKDTWHGYPIDYARWNYCHGAYSKYRVMWTIKHINLVNEIKKYTRPFIVGEQNWYYEINADSGGLVSDFWTEFFHASEYDFFAKGEDAGKIIEQFNEEYILKILFKPIDGNYKVVMDWLAEWEENQ